MSGRLGTIAAAWPGQCKHPDCGRWFPQGEVIAFRRLDPRDEKPVAMHADCAKLWDNPADDFDGLRADDIVLRRGETVCGDCHLVHRGECA